MAGLVGTADFRCRNGIDEVVAPPATPTAPLSGRLWVLKRFGRSTQVNAWSEAPFLFSRDDDRRDGAPEIDQHGALTGRSADFLEPITGVGIVDGDGGPLPPAPPPRAALVKAPLRIAGLLFVEAASTAFQGGTDIRAFRYMTYACEQQGTATRNSPRDARR